MASKKTTNPVNNEETPKKSTRKTANKELGKNAEAALNQAEAAFNGKEPEEECATSTKPHKIPVITINGTPIPMNAMGLHALATTFYLNAIGCETDEEAEEASHAHFDDPDPNDEDYTAALACAKLIFGMGSMVTRMDEVVNAMMHMDKTLASIDGRLEGLENGYPYDPEFDDFGELKECEGCAHTGAPLTFHGDNHGTIVYGDYNVTNYYGSSDDEDDEDDYDEMEEDDFHHMVHHQCHCGHDAENDDIDDDENDMARYVAAMKDEYIQTIITTIANAVVDQERRHPHKATETEDVNDYLMSLVPWVKSMVDPMILEEYVDTIMLKLAQTIESTMIKKLGYCFLTGTIGRYTMEQFADPVDGPDGEDA